jgi:hypothetical protein
MKTLATILILALGLTLSTSVSAAKPGRVISAPAKKARDQKKCLEICARPMFRGEAMKDVTIRLYKADQLVYQILASEEPRIFFALDPNSNYSVKFSKEGYTDRLISINTTIPDDVVMSPIFTFDFDIEMVAQNVSLDEFYLDFPVALVTFDKRKEIFGYNREYTRKISTLQRKAAEMTMN